MYIFAKNVWGMNFFRWSSALPDNLQIISKRKDKKKKKALKNFEKKCNPRRKGIEKNWLCSSKSFFGSATPINSTKKWFKQFLSIHWLPGLVSKKSKNRLSRSAKAERWPRGASRWPRRRWPSCPQILLRCICRLLRCRSSGQRMTPLTVEEKVQDSHSCSFKKIPFFLYSPGAELRGTRGRRCP